MPASVAWAHGGGETEEGYLLVQQALGHLAHDTSASGIDLAMEKISDTLSTKDQEGVNVAEVEQAKAALESADVPRGRTLLQHSISEAISQLKPATGEETGTTVVLEPLRVRGSFAGGEWSVLVLSMLLLVVGVALAYRYRPRENMHELHRRLDPIPVAPAVTSSDTSADGES
ncbi:MAG: hypothetical protein ABI912_12670 [Actinomycetota bacterium]